MAGTEKFIFEVEAKTNRALSELHKVYQLMKQIERIRNRGVDEYTTITQKDMDKSMRNMAQITRDYKKMSRSLRELRNELKEVQDGLTVPSGLDGDARKRAEQEVEQMKRSVGIYVQQAKNQQRELQMAYKETLRQFRQLATFQQNYSKNFKHIFSSDDLFNLPRDRNPDGTLNKDRARSIMRSMVQEADGASSKLDEVIAQIKEVEKLDRRSESLSRRASASGYMSYQQAQSFSKDYSTTRGYYRGLRKENFDRLVDIGLERTELFNQVKEIENKVDSTQEERDKKIALQQTIQVLDKEREARMKLSRALDRTISNMDTYNEAVQGVEVKPERGTFLGMVYERAPAIGLAFGGAVGMTFGSLYQRGGSAERNMRDDVIAIGQRTGQANWREDVRDRALNQGLMHRLGFTGQEMLSFQQTYLSNRGYRGMEDLSTAAMNQAIFSRVTGTSADRTAQFFDRIFSSATLQGADVKDIQDAFVGGIKQSGMEGREEDQLAALEGLLGEVSRGRKLDRDDVLNVMGLTSILNASGVDALRGQTGAQLLQDLSSGIRQGFQDPSMRLLFGMGSQFQGIEGRWELRKMMEQGISNPENLQRMGLIAQAYGQGNTAMENETFATLANQMGVDITTEQAEGLMDLIRSGQLTEENINKVLQNDMATGSELSDQKLESYQGQKEATANQSDAVTEKQAIQFNDLGDALRSVNASMGGLNVALYAAIVAMGSLTAALIGSAGSFALSRGVRRFARGTYRTNGNWFRMGQNRGGGGPGGGGLGGLYFGGGDGSNRKGGGGGKGGPVIYGPDGKPISSDDSKGGGKQKGGGKFKGRFGWLGNLFSTGASKVGGWFSNGKGGGGGAPLGILPGNGPNGGGLFKGGGLGNLANRALLPLAIFSGAQSIMAAPEGEKAKALGEVGGGLGGGWAGSSLGATIGSFLGPIGTVVGGGIGGLIGSLAGSKVGGWIGDGLGKVGGWIGDGLSAVGGWIGSGIKGIGKFLGFGGDDDKKKEEKRKIDTGGNSVTGVGNIREQLERENANKKSQTEEKRGDNISEERTNLDKEAQLVNDYDRLLTQSRLQGGILGNGMFQNTSSPANTNGIYGPTNLTGNSNAEKIWNFFASKGFSPEAISGIMGNLQQESGLNPNAVNPSSGAFGIGQWLGGRKTNLQNFAKQMGLSPNSLEAQLQFMWHELNGGDSTTASILNKNGGLGALMNSKNVNSATKLFENAFERSGESAMSKRYSYAQDFYNQFGKAQWGTAGVTTMANRPAKVESNITVTVRGDETVSDKLKNSKDLERAALAIQEKVYGSMSFHALDTRRV